MGWEIRYIEKMSVGGGPNSPERRFVQTIDYAKSMVEWQDSMPY